MSKVLLINGSPNEHGCIDTALNEVKNTLVKNGVDGEILWLGKEAMQDCVACFYCQKNGKCVFNDKVNEVASKLDEYKGIIIGSPTYYSGPTGRLQSFLDRLIFSAGSKKFEGKFGASVVSCRRGGATATFERLNQFFLMVNMHVVSSQYWNQVHGYTPDDVRKDLEGMQTMRTLGQNMAFLIKSKETAIKNGVEVPIHEETTYTNFID